MSIRTCRGCEKQQRVDVRQLRIYARRRQWQFQLTLCTQCFDGLFDLIRLSSDGFSGDLWNPQPQKASSQ